MTPVELLSPAKNLDYGKAAIQHGADAVYIGAPAFSARAGASNTIDDIEKLVRFAHLYRARVYVTLNTILYDDEIEKATRIIRQLYQSGVDAVIIQDLGLLQCDLPPVPLFASTQTHNVTPEKIAFLEKAGFQRVILARELTLEEIRLIREHSSLELECFIHGALCVSYSGQCYMSQAVAERSGNRGVCAQPCRSSWQLSDAGGNILIEQSHLLSLKDLNLSAYLYDLLRAGVTSFKIEGRLKDINYVKNITAFYRKRIDALLEHNDQWRKASSGSVEFYFEPDPCKTFNRGYTSYFINGRKEKVASPFTQKSTGEQIGMVKQSGDRWFIVETTAKIANGDGLCWLHPGKGLEGVLVNKTDGNRIYPAKPVQIKPGTRIYRNNDFLFEKQLSGHSAIRKIHISFEIKVPDEEVSLKITDEDGNNISRSFVMDHIMAKDPQKAKNQIEIQMGKLGNTAFICDTVKLPASFPYFVPVSRLNEMRRKMVEELEEYRTALYRTKDRIRETTCADFPEKKLDYRANLSNKAVKEFYRRRGVESMEDAFELQHTNKGKIVMTTKYCIRHQYDQCPVEQKSGRNWKNPLFLKNNHSLFRLEFDCKKCMMNIIQV